MSGARDLTKLPGYGSAIELYHKSLSPRYKHLDLLERYVEGSQYADWPAKWLGSDDVPLLERAPSVVEPIVRSALESYEDLLVGEGRFPAITTAPEEDDEDEDDGEGIGLSEDESKGADRLIKHIAKQTMLPSAACKAYRRGAGARTAVTKLGVKRGKLTIESFLAKRCWATWDKDDPEKLIALEIKYPYITIGEGVGEHKLYAGRARVVWYRRTIDELLDIVYKPASANQDGSEPTSWTAQTPIKHGYGFCPVVWWAHAKDDDHQESDDGRAIHELLLEEIDSLNRACSQHNRAALYCGDPQTIERGVEEGHNPAPGGRQARVPMPYVGEDPSLVQPYRQPGRQSGARRKGPGVVWQYPPIPEGPLPDVDLLTLPGDALDAVAKDRDDLRNMLAVAMAWVKLDENSLRNPQGGQSSLTNLSGRALEMLYRRQLSRCNKERVDLGTNWIKPVVNMLLRIVIHHVQKADGGVASLFLRGMKVLSPELIAKLSRPVVNPAGAAVDEWTGPELNLKWPPYFEPNENDAAVISKQAREDYKAGFIKLETAVERIAPFYDIEAVEAYVKELVAEADEKDEKLAKAEAAKGSHLTAAIAGLNAGTTPAGGAKPGAKPATPPGKPGLAAKRGAAPPSAAASR